jgi:hypothetical protein
MNKIYLKGKNAIGKYVIVDNEDFYWLNKFNWYLNKNLHYPFNEYARRNRLNKNNSDQILMHRVILEKYKIKIENKLIDHINNNSLDNRKSNLRIATKSQNKAHGQIYKNNSTGYRGVYYEENFRPNKKWRVRISVNGKDKHVGRYKTKEEAALAYNEVAIQYFGKFAYINQSLHILTR